VTDKQLEGLAMQALNLAKTDRQYKRWRGFLVADWHEGGQLHRMRKVERTIIELAGEDWLDHGDLKSRAFGIMRMVVKFLNPGALVFVTACNRFVATPQLMALPKKEIEQLMNASHERHHEAAAEGLLELQDAFIATAQTAERVCTCTHRVGRRGALLGQPEVQFFPQAHFDGRMKMYGEGEHCIDLDLEEMLREAALRGVQ